MNQLWLITGGAGFIGSNFVRLALAQPGVEVLVIDKLTYAGHRISLAEVESDPRFSFVQADIADAPAMAELFRSKQPSAVLNFAAESHVDRSIDGPEAFVRTNVVGVFSLLEAARSYLAEASDETREAFRFLHVSTDEVFGSLGAEGAFTETTPYDPRSPYSATKAGADHLVQAYHHTYGLPTLLTNCSNNYGPFQFPEKLIPLMTLNALEGKALPIYGDGLNVRDWIHVEDHCAGILAALLRGTPGQSYNIGADSERTNLQVVDALCAALEQVAPAAGNARLREAGKQSYSALKTFVPDRPGHDRRYAIDASKVRSELGWAPRYSFEEGIVQTVRWYFEHRDWCATVQQDNYGRQRLGLAETGEGEQT